MPQKHQELKRRNCRSVSFSQDSRTSFFMRNNMAIQVSHGILQLSLATIVQECKMAAMIAPDPGLPVPHQRKSHRYQDNEDEYTFNMSSNAMCWDIKDLLVDNLDVLATLLNLPDH